MGKKPDPKTEMLLLGGSALIISLWCLFFLLTLTGHGRSKPIDLIFGARWIASIVIAFGVCRRWPWSWSPGVSLFGVYSALWAAGAVFNLTRYIQLLPYTRFDPFTAAMIVGFPFGLAWVLGVGGFRMWRHRALYGVVDKPFRRVVFQGLARALAFVALDTVFLQFRLRDMVGLN